MRKISLISHTAASIVSSCFLLTQGQDTIATKISIAVEPLNPVAGQSVTLTPGVVLEDFKRCHWYHGVTAESEELIFTHTPPFYVPGAAYTRRETMGPGCSLHIRNLVPEDSGIYTVTLDESGMLSTTGHVDMEVSGMTFSSPSNAFMSGMRKSVGLQISPQPTWPMFRNEGSGS